MGYRDSVPLSPFLSKLPVAPPATATACSTPGRGAPERAFPPYAARAAAVTRGHSEQTLCLCQETPYIRVTRNKIIQGKFTQSKTCELILASIRI